MIYLLFTNDSFQIDVFREDLKFCCVSCLMVFSDGGVRICWARRTSTRSAVSALKDRPVCVFHNTWVVALR